MPNKYVSHTAAFKKKFKKRREATLEAIGQTSTSWIIAAAPVGKDGGSHYKSSIQYEVDPEEGKVTDYTDALYAPYLEFGTGIYAENGKGRKTRWRYKDDHGDWHITRGMRPRKIFRVVEDRIKDLQRLAAEMMKID